MTDLLKYMGTIVMLCIATSLIGQCIADFEFDDSSLAVTFNNQSQNIVTDSITLYSWDFGDGITSEENSPLNIYAQGGAYDVTLTITTEQGCTHTVTKSIYICNFDLDYDLQAGCDEDNKVTLDLLISDIYGTAEEINVYLDGELLNNNPLSTTNDTVSIGTELLADGLEHVLTIQSLNNPNCELTEVIQVTACVPPCYLSDLKAKITSNGAVNVLVTESGYDPQSLNVITGDTIIYNWATDNKSVTSNPNNNGQNWDSGILNTGDQYKLFSYAPGIYSYSSTNTPNGIMEGSLVSTCPDSAYYDLLITFRHEGQIGAYNLWIDGVPTNQSNIPYDISGLDSVHLVLPGDGLLHTYEIIDASSPSCKLFTTVQAPLCGVTSDCNLFVTATQTTSCDQDSLVKVDFTILSAGGSSNGFDLFIDEELFESNIAYTGTETIITRSLFGDGEEHSIRIVDTSLDTCNATSSILLEDCAEPCIILNAFAGVGSNKSIVANVLNDSFSPQDITISVGDNIIWQWQGDTLRSVTAYDFLFDSGVKEPGDTYTSPLLPIGVHRYYSEFNGMEGSITVRPNCEGDLIPIVYTFNKFGGANSGYDVFVDSIKINGSPIPYSDNGNNSGNSFVNGNGDLHRVQIVDAVDTICGAIEIFEVPFCEASICALFLENLNVFECNSNNTIDLSLDLLSYNPLNSRFLLAVNGLITDTLSYDTSGVTTIDFNFAGDGDLREITVMDLTEDICAASFEFTPAICDNPCSFDSIDIEYLIESVGDSCFDGSVQFIVTTQAVHDFNSDYTILIESDSTIIEQLFDYPSNGIISHSFSLPANGDLLDIIFINNADSNCQIDTSFNIYACTPDPCNLSLTDITFDNCRDGGIMDMKLEIDTFRISDSLSILLDEIEIFKGSYTEFYDTSGFEVVYNGLERRLNIIDLENEACNSEDVFITPFCTIDCTIDADYMVSDSCILAQDSTYNIIITGNVVNAISDSIQIDVEGSDMPTTHTYDDLINGITLSINRTNENPTLTIFDLADDSCQNILNIDPPTCILDCEISINNVIFPEEGCINGVRKVTFEVSYEYQYSDSLDLIIDGILIASDLYPVDSLITTHIIGDGLTHNVLIRDRSNPGCSDSLDFVALICEFNCADFLVDFEVNIDTFNRTVNYTDLTIGNPDKWTWDLGDNTVSSDANPFHTYSTIGTYIICLTAENQDEGCIQSICKEIDLVDIDCLAEYNFTTDGLTVTFESISTADQSIDSLIWTIDGETILSNATNGLYTSSESTTIELCLNIQTISDCNSVNCEIIELTNPCTIAPSFDAIITFDTIQLANTSIGDYNFTSWTFGDGITFTGNEVEYVYPQDGDYEVCMTTLSSETADCEFTICEMVSISSCEVNATFLVNILQDTLNAQLIAPLEDLSISWDFGNGFSADINPVQFIYTLEGDYTICATVSNNNLENCTESHCEEISIILTDVESAVLKELEIYPNPIQIGEYLKVVNINKIYLRIGLYTVTGQIINTPIVNYGDYYSISTNSLTAGNYLLRISTLEENVIKPIILVE